MLGLFIAATFLSACLLFFVQPMAGKLVLPLLGGSPAVWVTSMLFFQAVLLGGYSYAHLLGRLRSARVQAAIHVLVMAGALLALPVALPAGWEPPVSSSPIPWLLALLAAAIGGPLFVLSSTGPLLQRWLASTDDPAAKDPYFLYAAGNAGSMLGLLGYPALELAMGLRVQGLVWSMGYALSALLAAACGAAMLRCPGRPSAQECAPPAPVPPIGWKTRTRWVLLALVPCSLMLGVTLHLTTDIASVPLLWIVPLALYLLTFIVAFARSRTVSSATASMAYAATAILLAAAFTFHVSRPVWAMVLLHLLALFWGATACHRRLAEERPDPRRLTEFYLLIALGGVLGGVFCALVAPLLFKAVLEYPAALFLALLLRRGWHGKAERPTSPRLARAIDFAIPALGFLLFVAGVTAVHAVAPQLLALGRERVVGLLELAVSALPLLIMAACIRRRLRFALAFAVVVLIVETRVAASERLLYAQRTFFGVHRVFADPQNQWHRLAHGTTSHGIQYTDPRLSFRPMMYYHPTGPIGDVFRAFVDDPGMTRVGVIGLGAGSLSAYGMPGRHFTYFEIDPAVAAIAENAALFTYVRDARKNGTAVDVVLGDARLTIRRQPDAVMDLLVCDAFGSDAIPLHLITREAVELYLHKLRPHGLLVFHVSNVYLELRPPLGAIARDLGLLSYSCTDPRPPEGWPPSWIGKEASRWVILARRDEDLKTIPRSPSANRWTRYVPAASVRAWTDDYTNILTAFDWS